jgi:hypothetical protein
LSKCEQLSQSMSFHEESDTHDDADAVERPIPASAPGVGCGSDGAVDVPVGIPESVHVLGGARIRMRLMQALTLYVVPSEDVPKAVGPSLQQYQVRASPAESLLSSFNV